MSYKRRTLRSGASFGLNDVPCNVRQQGDKRKSRDIIPHEATQSEAKPNVKSTDSKVKLASKDTVKKSSAIEHEDKEQKLSEETEMIVESSQQDECEIVEIKPSRSHCIPLSNIGSKHGLATSTAAVQSDFRAFSKDVKSQKKLASSLLDIETSTIKLRSLLDSDSSFHFQDNFNKSAHQALESKETMHDKDKSETILKSEVKTLNPTCVSTSFDCSIRPEGSTNLVSQACPGEAFLVSLSKDETKELHMVKAASRLHQNSYNVYLEPTTFSQKCPSKSVESRALSSYSYSSSHGKKEDLTHSSRSFVKTSENLKTSDSAAAGDMWIAKRSDPMDVEVSEAADVADNKQNSRLFENRGSIDVSMLAHLSQIKMPSSDRQDSALKSRNVSGVYPRVCLSQYPLIGEMLTQHKHTSSCQEEDPDIICDPPDFGINKPRKAVSLLKKLIVTDSGQDIKPFTSATHGVGDDDPAVKRSERLRSRQSSKSPASKQTVTAEIKLPTHNSKLASSKKKKGSKKELEVKKKKLKKNTKVKSDKDKSSKTSGKTVTPMPREVIDGIIQSIEETVMKGSIEEEESYIQKGVDSLVKTDACSSDLGKKEKIQSKMEGYDALKDFIGTSGQKEKKVIPLDVKSSEKQTKLKLSKEQAKPKKKTPETSKSSKSSKQSKQSAQVLKSSSNKQYKKRKEPTHSSIDLLAFPPSDHSVEQPPTRTEDRGNKRHRKKTRKAEEAFGDYDVFCDEEWPIKRSKSKKRRCSIASSSSGVSGTGSSSSNSTPRRSKRASQQQEGLRTDPILVEHAFILWASDHRREVEQQHPDASTLELDAILSSRWSGVSDHAKSKFFQRAKEAFGDDERQNRTRTLKDVDPGHYEELITGCDPLYTDFINLNVDRQRELLKKWLKFFQKMLPKKEYAEFITIFKCACGKEEKGSGCSTDGSIAGKSSRPRMRCLDPSFYKILFDMIRLSKPRVLEIHQEKRIRKDEKVSDTYNVMLRKLVTKQQWNHFIPGCHSYHLSQLLKDLQELSDFLIPSFPLYTGITIVNDRAKLTDLPIEEDQEVEAAFAHAGECSVMLPIQESPSPLLCTLDDFDCSVLNTDLAQSLLVGLHQITELPELDQSLLDDIFLAPPGSDSNVSSQSSGMRRHNSGLNGFYTSTRGHQVTPPPRQSPPLLGTPPNLIRISGGALMKNRSMSSPCHFVREWDPASPTEELSHSGNTMYPKMNIHYPAPCPSAAGGLVHHRPPHCSPGRGVNTPSMSSNIGQANVVISSTCTTPSRKSVSPWGMGSEFTRPSRDVLMDMHSYSITSDSLMGDQSFPGDDMTCLKMHRVSLGKSSSMLQQYQNHLYHHHQRPIQLPMAASSAFCKGTRLQYQQGRTLPISCTIQHHYSGTPKVKTIPQGAFPHSSMSRMDPDLDDCIDIGGGTPNSMETNFPKPYQQQQPQIRLGHPSPVPSRLYSIPHPQHHSHSLAGLNPPSPLITSLTPLRTGAVKSCCNNKTYNSQCQMISYRDHHHSLSSSQGPLHVSHRKLSHTIPISTTLRAGSASTARTQGGMHHIKVCLPTQALKIPIAKLKGSRKATYVKGKLKSLSLNPAHHLHSSANPLSDAINASFLNNNGQETTLKSAASNSSMLAKVLSIELNDDLDFIGKPSSQDLGTSSQQVFKTSNAVTSTSEHGEKTQEDCEILSYQGPMRNMNAMARSAAAMGSLIQYQQQQQHCLPSSNVGLDADNATVNLKTKDVHAVSSGSNCSVDSSAEPSSVALSILTSIHTLGADSNDRTIISTQKLAASNTFSAGTQNVSANIASTSQIMTTAYTSSSGNLNNPNSTPLTMATDSSFAAHSLVPANTTIPHSQTSNNFSTIQTLNAANTFTSQSFTPTNLSTIQTLCAAKISSMQTSANANYSTIQTLGGANISSGQTAVTFFNSQNAATANTLTTPQSLVGTSSPSGQFVSSVNTYNNSGPQLLTTGSTQTAVVISPLQIHRRSVFTTALSQSNGNPRTVLSSSSSHTSGLSTAEVASNCSITSQSRLHSEQSQIGSRLEQAPQLVKFNSCTQSVDNSKSSEEAGSSYSNMTSKIAHKMLVTTMADSRDGKETETEKQIVPTEGRKTSDVSTNSTLQSLYGAKSGRATPCDDCDKHNSHQIKTLMSGCQQNESSDGRNTEREELCTLTSLIYDRTDNAKPSTTTSSSDDPTFLSLSKIPTILSENKSANFVPSFKEDTDTGAHDYKVCNNQFGDKVKDNKKNSVVLNKSLDNKENEMYSNFKQESTKSKIVSTCPKVSSHVSTNIIAVDKDTPLSKPNMTSAVEMSSVPSSSATTVTSQSQDSSSTSCSANTAFDEIGSSSTYGLQQKLINTSNFFTSDILRRTETSTVVGSGATSDNRISQKIDFTLTTDSQGGSEKPKGITTFAFLGSSGQETVTTTTANTHALVTSPTAALETPIPCVMMSGNMSSPVSRKRGHYVHEYLPT